MEPADRLVSVEQVRRFADDPRTSSTVRERVLGGLSRVEHETSELAAGSVERDALVRTFQRRANVERDSATETGARRVLEALLQLGASEVLVLAVSVGDTTMNVLVADEPGWVVECVVR